MNLIHVIPIARGIFREELTYFTKDALPEGSLVQVPLRKRSIPGIVVSSTSVKDAKAHIKSSDFQIRRIHTPTHSQFLLPEFIEAAKRAAEYYVASPGAILFASIPKAIRELETPPALKTRIYRKTKNEPHILQAPRTIRLEEYKQLARKAFAQKQSIFILAPTLQEVETISRALERGIGRYLYTFHSGLAKGKVQTLWQDALANDHPIVAIMTGSFLSLPRHDLGTIVIEREQTNTYKGHARPYLDIRNLASLYATELGALLVRGDQPLSVESIHHYKKGRYDSLRDVPTHLTSPVHTSLIDMREEVSDSRWNSVAVCSKKLIESITQNIIEREGHAFLYAARRGIAPVTVCNDCNTRVSCLACGAPVVVHKAANEHIFVCHSCGAMRSAHERCKHCTSWKLQMLGIGIGLVEQEIRRLFPETPIFIFDRDAIKTHRQGKKLIEEFYDTPGSILLGTEAALPYIEAPVTLSAIISMDSLLSVPEWNIYERIMSIVLRTQERTDRHMFVQTRKPDEEVLLQAIKGNLGSFYTNELKDRKEFNYPPFARLIKLSAEGNPDFVEQTMQDLEARLSPFGFSTIPHLLHSPKGKHIMHGFIRKKVASWPDPELLSALRSLPPSISIELDPESIL